MQPRILKKYITTSGICPFDSWLSSLKDKRTKAIIATRLNRLIQGNFGSCKKLGAIWELKINFGPGFRVYFGEEGKEIVILLTCGDKSTQSDDIEKAKACWRDYLEDENE